MGEEELKNFFDLMCKKYYSEIDGLEADSIIRFILEMYNDKYTRIVKENIRIDNIFDLLGLSYIFFENIAYIIKGKESTGIFNNDIILNGKKILENTEKNFVINRKGKIIIIKIPQFQKKLCINNQLIKEDRVYIKIENFNDDIMNKISSIEFNDKYIIIDLRDNMGGKIVEAHKFLEFFIESDQKIYYLKDKEKNIYGVNLKRSNKKIKQNRVTVLVNENTASSAELVTAVLKEKINATIIGHITRGKGVMQKRFQLSEKKSILIPIYEFYTLNFIINNRGIKPDLMLKDSTIEKWINKGVWI